MKTIIALFVCSWMMVGVANAQDSLRVQPSPSLPQRHEKIGNQHEQKEDRIEVNPGDIPSKMRDALQNESKYRGWENGRLYFEKNSDQYLLHLVKENSTQTYRFDKSGYPITTEKATESSELKN
jgi:hypothetical protein